MYDFVDFLQQNEAMAFCLSAIGTTGGAAVAMANMGRTQRAASIHRLGHELAEARLPPFCDGLLLTSTSNNSAALLPGLSSFNRFYSPTVPILYQARASTWYTPTLRKSGKTACQPPLRRFCLIDDPPWLPGQLLALRPD
jgi:hypothetical protein